jgi:plasmid stabilization system protein ParE
MYSVHITDLAEDDILSSVKYIADVLKAPVSANHLLDEIEKYENTLENTPNMYSFVPDDYLTTKGLKYAMVKNFMLFYTINEEEKMVNVIRFLYGRRDWKNILKNNLGKINCKGPVSE